MRKRYLFIFTVASVACETVLGLGLALAMNAQLRLRGWIRAAVLVPWAIPTVVTSVMWGWIYNTDYGVISYFLRSLGLIETNLNWLSEPGLAMAGAILADVWKTTPFIALILLAGLQTIPNELYEAAKIDGAGRWQSFWRITLPLLVPIMLVAVLLRFLDAFRVFALIFVLTNGGPADGTEVLSTYGYKIMFSTLKFGLGSAVAMTMFVYVLVSSVKFPVDLIKLPPLLPELDRVTFGNYAELFSGRPFHRYIVNSVIVATGTTLFCLLVGSFSAYALARLPIRGKLFILGAILSVSMFPEVSIVSALYLILRDLELLDTYPGLIFPYTSFALPLTLWILTSFFRKIPQELEEAALIDGATPLVAMLRIIFPLAAPGIFTTAILVFIAAWNEFLFALTFTSTIEHQTVPVGIARLPVMFEVPWGTISAASVMVTAPLIVLVLIFQRRIVEGLTAGGVKE